MKILFYLCLWTVFACIEVKAGVPNLNEVYIEETAEAAKDGAPVPENCRLITSPDECGDAAKYFGENWDGSDVSNLYDNWRIGCFVHRGPDIYDGDFALGTLTAEQRTHNGERRIMKCTVFYVKGFEGHCVTTSLEKNKKYDWCENPGTDKDSNVAACAAVCATGDFLGFAVLPTIGRCFCHKNSSATCMRQYEVPSKSTCSEEDKYDESIRGYEQYDFDVLCTRMGITLGQVTRKMCSKAPDTCEVYIKKSDKIKTCQQYCQLYNMSCTAQYDDYDGCARGTKYPSCDDTGVDTSDHICQCEERTTTVTTVDGEDGALFTFTDGTRDIVVVVASIVVVVIIVIVVVVAVVLCARGKTKLKTKYKVGLGATPPSQEAKQSEDEVGADEVGVPLPPVTRTQLDAAALLYRLDVSKIELRDDADVTTADRTFASSYFKALYGVAHVPEDCVDMLQTVKQLIMIYATTHCISTNAWRQFYKRLYDEAFKYPKVLQGDVASAAEYVWTSTEILLDSIEFCGILNWAIRSDRADAMVPVAMFTRAINRRRVQRVPNALQKSGYPHDGKLWRGSSFDDVHCSFFRISKKYRVPGFLATSLNKKTSNWFLSRVPSGSSSVMWCIQVDPKGKQDFSKRCRNASFVDKTHAKGEGEYLFAPYSAFTVLKVKWSEDLREPHRITVAAAFDNTMESERLPLAPWY